MPAQPLSSAEQFAFTSGHCLLFAEAAWPIVGGTPTILVSTGARLAQRHDHPEDLPLDLHVFLTLMDGSVVDGEGQRSLTDLLRGFGVRARDDFFLISDPDFQEARKRFGTSAGTLSSRWQRAIRDRLAELGWTAHDLPPAGQALAQKSDFKKAMDAWHQEWLKHYLDRLTLQEPGIHPISPNPDGDGPPIKTPRP